jgi:hypothetical protein
VADAPLDALSAALRHVRDAEHLSRTAEEHASLDQSYHLAGFGPECARKAALGADTYARAIGHGVGPSSEAALRFALATDGAARRYDLEEWRTTYPALAGWSESARYEPTGRREAAEVAALVAEARRIVDAITYALWADGRIPQAFTW